MTQVDDPVNHPVHYNSHPSGVEVITITRHMGFNLGNVVKYVLRCDLKNDALEDLRKAQFYLADEIAKREQVVDLEPTTMTVRELYDSLGVEAEPPSIGVGSDVNQISLPCFKQGQVMALERRAGAMCARVRWPGIPDARWHPLADLEVIA